MKVEIFDVEHGQCAMITCPNGKKVMVDAGHNTDKWWPSTHFRGQEIEKLIITNYDEDHTSDIVAVESLCRVKCKSRNPTVTATALRQMKAEHGMGRGVKHLHDWLVSCEAMPGGFPVTVDTGEVQFNHYWINWPHATDANNLSLVTFANYNGFTILFPGDIERKGWKILLELPDFRRDLARTTVLLASHHGRENGCCQELYDNGLYPMVTIISDAGIEHATQETVSWYANRTWGCRVRNSTDPRKVMTTRSDGYISINVSPDGSWNIGPAGTTRTQPVVTPWSARSALLSRL